MNVRIPFPLANDPRRSTARSWKRGAMLVAACSVALMLSACGGGGGIDVGGLSVSAVVAGQPVSGAFFPSSIGTVDMIAGQAIELDASEPVVWGFSVAGSPLFGNGTTVFFNGLAITETMVSPSRVVLQTSVTGPFFSPITISMSATSTFDAAQVAAVDLVVH